MWWWSNYIYNDDNYIYSDDLTISNYKMQFIQSTSCCGSSAVSVTSVSVAVCCFFGELALGSFIQGIMKLFFLLAFSACESDGSWIKAAIRTQSSVRTPSKSHYWSDCVITWLSLNPRLQQQKETLPPSRALTIPCHDLQLVKEILSKLPDSQKTINLQSLSTLQFLSPQQHTPDRFRNLCLGFPLTTDLFKASFPP